jgi:hypothetical protein
LNSEKIALIVFACVFGSAMAGFSLGEMLPGHYLAGNAINIIELATGLIATLVGMVLGLLVSSAKGRFDRVSRELLHGAAQVVMLDRILAQYGPETGEIRAAVKSAYISAMEKFTSGSGLQQVGLQTPEWIARFEGIQASIQAATPQNDAQQVLKARAIQVSTDLDNFRWSMSIEEIGSISIPMLVIVVFWLSFIFVAWGVISPRNVLVAIALLASALSVAGAVFLIVEMDQPLNGWIRVSSRRLRKALAILGE